MVQTGTAVGCGTQRNEKRLSHRNIIDLHFVSWVWIIFTSAKMGSINAIWVSGEEVAKAMRGAEEARRKLSVLLLMVDLCFAANGNGTTASQQEKWAKRGRMVERLGRTPSNARRKKRGLKPNKLTTCLMLHISISMHILKWSKWESFQRKLWRFLFTLFF